MASGTSVRAVGSLRADAGWRFQCRAGRGSTWRGHVSAGIRGVQRDLIVVKAHAAPTGGTDQWRRRGETGFVEALDLDGGGTVDFADFVAFAAAFGT